MGFRWYVGSPVNVPISIRWQSTVSNVTNALPPSLKLEGLLHDASEAYLADLPKPVKLGLRDYSLLEIQVETVIAERFNLACPTPSEVKSADFAMLKQEIFSFFGPARYSEDFQDPPGQSQHFSGFEPQVAESKFLELFCSLALAAVMEGERCLS
jgi:hypothetical protein